jgi:hypothetical protein
VTADPVLHHILLHLANWLHSGYRTHVDPKLVPTAFFLCGLSPHPNLAFAFC